MLPVRANHAPMGFDLAQGRPGWHYPRAAAARSDYPVCGQGNRGFAALGNKLFKVNLESSCGAGDSKTGISVGTESTNLKKGYTRTVAPLIVKNLSVVEAGSLGSRSTASASLIVLTTPIPANASAILDGARTGAGMRHIGAGAMPGNASGRFDRGCSLWTY